MTRSNVIMPPQAREEQALPVAARLAQADGYDVIAIATHGYSGFAKWALDSITERVLHATSLPFLIVRPANVIAREHQLAAHLKKAQMSE